MALACATSTTARSCKSGTALPARACAALLSDKQTTRDLALLARGDHYRTAPPCWAPPASASKTGPVVVDAAGEIYCTDRAARAARSASFSCAPGPMIGLNSWPIERVVFGDPSDFGFGGG